MYIFELSNKRTTILIKNKQTVEEMLHKVKYINGPKATVKTFRRTLEISKVQIETTVQYD